ncbi:beta-lactamase family protein [Candidatus Bathyarchaeota archaeon]|nr:beta-lactamase family protein [Candidatus Bathyarchaeota archaeon]
MTIKINGFCETQFKKLEKTFQQNFTSGLEVGASISLTINGKYVIDVWAGHKDAAKTKPWEKNTIVPVFSSTKVMSNLCIHMLVDRGLVDLDQPVAKYWSEFAQNGKEELPIKYLLSHTSGVPGWDSLITQQDTYNWNKVTGLLAAQKPWWKPGTACGYHKFTQGYMVGELVRRVTGKPIRAFFTEEVAEPSRADFHLGLPIEYEAQEADIIPIFASDVQSVLPPPGTISARVLTNPVLDPALSYVKSREWLEAEIPSGNGHGNARSMARIGSIIACGGTLDGKKYLSSTTLEATVKEQFYGLDLVLLRPVRWGLGWALPSEEAPFTPNWKTRKACVGLGAGGSLVLMDLEKKLCFAYAMNSMSLKSFPNDIRTEKMCRVLYECLDEPLIKDK